MARFTIAPPPAPQSLPPRQPREVLEEADRLRQQGKLDRAESTCFSLVRRYPGYVAALHTLGLVYLDKGDFERALDCLVRAAMRDPTNWMTLTALSLAYLRLGASEMAAETLNKALATRPRDASILTSLGEIHRQEREYELAQQAYRQALTLDPNMETPATGLALCLSACGQSAEAATVLSEAYGRGMRSLNLLHVLTTLPSNAVNIDILAALNQLAVHQSPADAAFKNTYLFVRAAALDAAGRNSEAWETLNAANRPLASEFQGQLKAHVTRREKSLERIRSFSKSPALPSGQTQPISLFILGASRSGKTSLERLVSSLDDVKAGSEVSILETAARRSFQAAAIPSSNHLEEIPRPLLSSFRLNYLEDLVRRAGSARVFTNTLPGHIHNAFLIANVIPNVRFLLLKRGLEDTAWRIYLTKYLYGNPYAYDLKAIRAYLDWYNAMIDLVAEKLPDITRVISYEAMVGNPAATLSEAAELCGLGLSGVSVRPMPNDCGCSASYWKYL